MSATRDRSQFMTASGGGSGGAGTVTTMMSSSAALGGAAAGGGGEPAVGLSEAMADAKRVLLQMTSTMIMFDDDGGAEDGDGGTGAGSGGVEEAKHGGLGPADATGFSDESTFSMSIGFNADGAAAGAGEASEDAVGDTDGEGASEDLDDEDMRNLPAFRDPRPSGTAMHDSSIGMHKSGRTAPGDVPRDSRVVPGFGRFRFTETPAQQMARIAALRTESPEYAEALMMQGQMMVRLAATGKLEKLQELVDAARDEELLYYYTNRMFAEAVRAGQTEIIRFMFRNELPLNAPVVKTILHDLLDAPPFTESTMRMIACLVDCGVDVNYQRRPHYFSPLHIACAQGQAAVSKHLMSLGADMNSVAADDLTPLALAKMALAAMQEQDPVDEAGVAEATELVNVLTAASAQESWRRDPVSCGTSAQAEDGTSQAVERDGRTFSTYSG